jgi:hypothetical protein
MGVERKFAPQSDRKRGLFGQFGDYPSSGLLIASWASATAPLCSRHVWPRPPLLRCQRDQARLLDPAASPHSEHRAELERGGRAQPRCDALGARAVLGQGHQSRLHEHQRQGRGDRGQAGLPRGVSAAPLPRAGRQEDCGREAALRGRARGRRAERGIAPRNAALMSD